MEFPQVDREQWRLVEHARRRSARSTGLARLPVASVAAVLQLQTGAVDLRAKQRRELVAVGCA